MITKSADRAIRNLKTRDSQSQDLPEEGTPGVLGAGANAALPARRRRGWPWLLVLALAVGAWHYRPLWLPWFASGLAGGDSPPARTASRTIPVQTARVRRQDMPLFLNGLGTVTAFKTVTLRSRVDGELVKVSFTEGQMVGQGDLLAEIDPRPFEAQLEQAEGTLARDEATLQLAKITFSRGQELLRSKSIAQQQIDEEAAQVRQMAGTVQTDRGLVENAKLQMTYCRIVAPISGRIGLRLVDQGNIVHPNDALGMAVITQIQPIALVFPISQDELPRVQKQAQQGQTLMVDAYDRGFSTKLATGKLYAIDNQVDSTTGTVKLKAVFENDDGMLFPNQFVNVRLLVDTKRNAVIVPAASVQRGPNTTFVYVVQSDETVELRNIVIGATEGAETAVENGLSAGEVVVTDGLEKLQPGSRVSTREKHEESPVGNSTSASTNERRTSAGGNKGPR